MSVVQVGTSSYPQQSSIKARKQLQEIGRSG